MSLYEQKPIEYANEMPMSSNDSTKVSEAVNRLSDFIPDDGHDGQLLKSNGDGTAEWSDAGTPTDAQVGTAVSAWLTAHPEATTTVEDGAISRAKLDADLKEKTDAVSDLKSALYDTVASLYGQIQIKSGWEKGVFEAGGYSNDTNANYCRTTKVFPAGKYTISTASSGYYYEVYTYVNDTSGTKIYGMGSTSHTFTATDPFVVSSRKNPTATITDEERATYNDNVSIVLILSDENGDINDIKSDVQTLESKAAGQLKDEILMDTLVFFYKQQRPIISFSGTNISVTVQANPRGLYVKDGVLAPIASSITGSTFTVPAGSYFVYNITDAAFEVKTVSEINAETDEIAICFHNHNGYLYGQWDRYLLEDEITAAIAESKNYTDQQLREDSLPSYYDSYMPSKLSTIRSNIATAGHLGVSFVFISDVHYDSAQENNMRKSPLLIRSISQNTPVKLMICGGDMITSASGSKDGGLALEQECITDFRVKSQMDTYWTVGNHEYNNPGADPALIGQQLSLSEVYPFITQGNYESIVLSDETGAYYMDDPKDKVRFLFTACNLDSTINTDSISWLIEQLPSTPVDYDLVLISHLGIYYNPTQGTYTGPVDAFKPILQALQAYKGHTTYSYDGNTYDFNSKTGTVLGAFLGHYHVDGEGVWNTIPCAIITTDSLNQRSGTLTRTAGTTTEQAFDVVTIDRTNSKIYCTRIGAGLDRTFENGEWTVES